MGKAAVAETDKGAKGAGRPESKAVINPRSLVLNTWAVSMSGIVLACSRSVSLR